MDVTTSAVTTMTPSSEHVDPAFDGPWMPRTMAEWYAMRQLVSGPQTLGAYPAAARRPPSYHHHHQQQYHPPPTQRSERNSLAARRHSPHGARVSKVSSASVPVGLHMSPSAPLKRRTTTAGTTSTRIRPSLAPPIQPPPHPSHHVPSQRPPPPAPARLVWGSIGDEDPWATMSARPITWHAASHASSQPSPSNRDAASYLAPPMDPWNLAGPASAWVARGNEPPTPSLYPASETTSPILPYSPSVSNVGLNDLDLTQIYDVSALDLGGPAYDGLPTAWLSAPPKMDALMLDATSSTMALTPPAWDAHHPPALDAARPSYLATASSPEMGSFLPIQRPPEVDGRSTVLGPSPPAADAPASAVGAEGDGDDKELVGMGLYDDVPSRAVVSTGPSSWLGLAGRATGKGLKLEETWAPPATAASRSEPVSAGRAAAVAADGMVLAPHLLDPTAVGLESSFLLDDGDLLDASRHFSVDGLYPALAQPSHPNHHLFTFI